MKFLQLMAAFCCCFISLIFYGQEKWSRIKINPPSDNHARSTLLGILQIDHFSTDSDGAILTEIGEKELNILKSLGYNYTLLVPDVVMELDSLNKRYYADKKNKGTKNSKVAFEEKGKTLNNIIPTPSAFEVKSTFGGYYSFAEMETAMNNLVAAYPLIAQKISIGTTYEGRNIWVIKISDNVATEETTEPGILYMGLQHAREAITGASMIFLMHYLCENYATDTRIKDLIDNRQFYIIPCFNPDGWEYNRTSMNGSAGGGWRKNRRVVDSTISQQNMGGGVKMNVVTPTVWGVDLNRNWGVDWANCSAPINGSTTSCGSGTTTSDTYWGFSAFSEAETQAVRDFTKNKNIKVGFDQHAFGPYYSLPFGRQALHTMPQKGQEFYTAIPALMGTYNGMRAADSYDALGYEVAGGFKDWMLIGEIGVGNKDTVWAMTGEGGAGGGSGGTYSSFWPPASQIINLCKGMTYQNIQLAYAAGTYVDIQDASSMAVTALSGSFNINLKRIGLGNSPITVSLVPLQNLQTVGTPVVVSSLSYYASNTASVNYTLHPSITDGQAIKFVWKVSMDGYSYTDTITKIYNPTVLFSDNMEGTFSTNWTASSNVADNWNYTTLSAFNGTKSLTESPAGNYTTNTTRTITYTGGDGWFDLTSATAAYLSFWVKHKAENFRDKLQVQVSTNSTTWVAIHGKTTVQETGTLDGSTINGQPALTGIKDYWINEAFDLDAYKGVPRLYLRFVFTSDGDPTTFKWERDDGFYIDDIMVLKSTTIMTVLPTKVTNFSGKLLTDKTVQLNWEAYTSEQHNFFEIERSADGINFETVGKSKKQPPYYFMDPSPKTGDNFYRIKQVDKDGKFSYTHIINIVVNNNFSLSVFPNPVQDVLTIKVNGKAVENLKIQIADVQGRIMLEEEKSINTNSADIKINMSSWKPQVYILTILNTRDEVISTQKIIKN